MTGYRLVDLGGAARLERFGDRLVDRPCPAALESRHDPALWHDADLHFERGAGWTGRSVRAGPWQLEVDGLTLALRATEAGQVGFFPEHVAMLTWLRGQVAVRVDGDQPPAVLHLFAYTGLATLAMTAAGGLVTHVDAARPTVTWARHNAQVSGLADRPIRWIVDDAVAFTEREIRRGRRYAGVVLDPPSYGHGPGSGAWQIETGLAPLLAAIARLLDPAGFLLLTAHTPAFGADRLAGLARQALGRPAMALEAGGLALATSDGRRLELGAFARLSGGA